MNNIREEIAMFSGDGILALLTASQTNELLQWISLALTILTTVVTLAFTIYKWWVKAKADGKITYEEVEELIKDIDKAKSDTENIIKTVTKEEEKDDQ